MIWVESCSSFGVPALILVQHTLGDNTGRRLVAGASINKERNQRGDRLGTQAFGELSRSGSVSHGIHVLFLFE